MKTKFPKKLQAKLEAMAPDIPFPPMTTVAIGHSGATALKAPPKPGPGKALSLVFEHLKQPSTPKK